MKKYRERRNMSFIGIQRSAAKNPPWKHLSSNARTVYLAIKGNYDGFNNGEIKLSYRDLEDYKDLKNRRTVSKAFKQLEKEGWIKITSRGGLYRIENTYELTFEHEGWS